MEGIVRPVGILRWQLRLMPYMAAVFIVAGAAVSIASAVSIVRSGPEQGYGLGIVMTGGLVLWWVVMFWLFRTYLLRTAQEVRYSVESGIIIRTALSGGTAITPGDVMLLRQRLFFPFPGAYTMRHRQGVHYLSAGEGFRDFQRYLRRENPDVKVSDV